MGGNVSLQLAKHEHPVNFTQLLEDIYGMGYPITRKQYDFLYNKNIRTIVNLTENDPFSELIKNSVPENEKEGSTEEANVEDGVFSDANKGRFNWHSIKMEDGRFPTFEEMDYLIDKLHKIILNETNVAVHCWQGRMRTNLLIFCYALKYRYKTFRDCAINFCDKSVMAMELLNRKDFSEYVLKYAEHVYETNI